MGVFGLACLATARQLDRVDFFGRTSPCRIHERVQLVQIDFQSADLPVVMDFLLGEFYQIDFVRSDLEGFGSDRWTPIDLGIRKLFHSIPDRYAGSIFSESRPSILGRSQGKKKVRSPRAPGDRGRLSPSDRSPAPDRARHPRAPGVLAQVWHVSVRIGTCRRGKNLEQNYSTWSLATHERKQQEKKFAAG
jgi:hypothetical protein